MCFHEYLCSQRVSVGVLTSHQHGLGVDKVERPEHGHYATTKQFFDIGHVGTQ